MNQFSKLHICSWMSVLILAAVGPSVGCRNTAGIGGSAKSGPQATFGVNPVSMKLVDEAMAVPQSQSDRASRLQLVSFQDEQKAGKRTEENGIARNVAPSEPPLEQSVGSVPTIDDPIFDPVGRSVEEYLQMALTSHPRIMAARSKVEAAQQRYPQAIALADPMVETAFFPIQSLSLQTAGGRMTNQMGISQEFPFPEKRRTKGEIANREVGMAQAEVETAEREIAESVRLAYYELWFANRAIEIVEKNRDLVAKMVQVAEARYKAGGSQQDVIRAELEEEKLEQQLVDVRQQKAVAQADLAALIQAPYAIGLETDSELAVLDFPAQLESLVNQAEQCNPELKGLLWQIQRDLEKQRLACLQKYPDIRLGTQYGMMSTGGSISPVADGLDMISFSVGMNLPVRRERIRAGVREATSEQISSGQQFEAEHLSIEGKLRRLLAEADSFQTQKSLFVDRINPKAEQALNVALSEYTVGKTSFVQLIDNYTEVLMFQLQTARLEATLAGTLARIERTVGCPLSRQ